MVTCIVFCSNVTFIALIVDDGVDVDHVAVAFARVDFLLEWLLM